MKVQRILKLEEANIDFCVWKNLHQKNEILNAKTDVDLYIPLEFMSEFEIWSSATTVLRYFPEEYNSLVSTIIIYLLQPEKSYTFTYTIDCTLGLVTSKFNLPIGDILISKRIQDQSWDIFLQEKLITLTIIRYYLKSLQLLVRCYI